jgi:hypothetical protein
MVALAEGGSYSLTARLEWGESVAVSAPLAFDLEALVTRAVDVGLSWRPGGAPEIYALWLHESHGHPVLFQGIFGEDRPDLGEVGCRAVVRIGEPAPGASRALTPFAAHSRLDDLIGWALWTEGAVLCGSPTMGVGPLRMTMPFVPSCIALPLLESRAHSVDAFIVGGAEARTLAMLRIDHGGLLRPSEGKVLWTWGCPEAVTAAAVGAQPNDYERIRHLALLSVSAGRATVRKVRVDDASPPMQISESAISNYHPVPDSPPAVLAQPDGSARVAVLAHEALDPSRCQLVEFRFGPGGGPASPAVIASMTLPVPAREGRIQYYSDALSGAYRCDCVIRGTNGAAYAFAGDGSARQVLPQQLSPASLGLIALRNHSYILNRESSGALQFVPV